MIDGEVYAAGPKAIEQVDGSDSRTVAARSDVLPSVAVASGDLWASAEGRTITVFDGEDERTVRTRADVRRPGGLERRRGRRHGEGRRAGRGRQGRDASARSGAGPTIHADGGMLWLTSKGDVVAIDRDQQQSHFRLRALDADLCIESCDAGDLAQLLKDQPTPTTEPEAEKATTTTAPPRDLQAPSTEPELPTTTTTTTPTTTEPAAPSTTIDRSPRNTTTTTEPKQYDHAGAAEADHPSAAADACRRRPCRPPRPQPPPHACHTSSGHRRRPSRPSRRSRLPPSTPPPLRRPPPTDPPPTDPPPTRPPPTEPVRYGLTLNVVPGDSSAQATASVVGPARPVRAVRLDRRMHRLVGHCRLGQPVGGAPLARQQRRERGRQVTIPNLQSGSLTVRFSACGVVTSSTVTIEGASPTVGEITLDNQPVEGQPFSASVPYTLPSGWSVTSANWNGNGRVLHESRKASPRSCEPSYTRQQFQANTAGPCHLSVVITFAPPNGGAPLQVDKQADIEIAPTTAPAGSAAAPGAGPDRGHQADGLTRPRDPDDLPRPSKDETTVSEGQGSGFRRRLTSPATPAPSPTAIGSRRHGRRSRRRRRLVRRDVRPPHRQHRPGDPWQARPDQPGPDRPRVRGPHPPRGRTRGRQDQPRPCRRRVDLRVVDARAVHAGPAAHRRHRRLDLEPGQAADFEFKPGPVFANIVIGDEINRASPKTQSALLEVMEERQVTVDGVSPGRARVRSW